MLKKNLLATVKPRYTRTVRIIRINVQYDFIESDRDAQNSKIRTVRFFESSRKQTNREFTEWLEE
jgi:hypothetical protein